MSTASGVMLLPVITIMSVFVFLSVAVASHYAYQMFKCACATRLKQRLAERGYSAHEIEQIVRMEVKNHNPAKTPPTAPLKPSKAY